MRKTRITIISVKVFILIISISSLTFSEILNDNIFLAPVSRVSDFKTVNAKSLNNIILSGLYGLKSKLPVSNDVYLTTLSDNFSERDQLEKFKSIKASLKKIKAKIKTRNTEGNKVPKSDWSLVSKYNGTYVGMSQAAIVNGDAMTTGLLTCSGFVAKSGNGLNVLGHLSPYDAISDEAIDEFVKLIRDYNKNHKNKITTLDFIFDHANAIYDINTDDTNYIDNNETFLNEISKELKKDKVTITYNKGKSIHSRIVDANNRSQIATNPRFRGIMQIKDKLIISSHYKYFPEKSVAGNKVKEYITSFSDKSSKKQLIKEIRKALGSNQEFSFKQDGDIVAITYIDQKSDIERTFIIDYKSFAESPDMLNTLNKATKASA